MNSARARAVALVVVSGVAGALVCGGWAWPAGLEAGAAALAGDDGGAVDVLTAWFWAGIITDVDGEYPAVLAAAGDGVAEVRGRVGQALGRLGWLVFTAEGEEALDWLPGSSTAPAKVSDRRGPSEVAMAATATAQTAVAAADNHSVGG